MEEKAKIIAWKDEGVSTANIAARIGRHRSSIDRLLVKSASLGGAQSLSARRVLEGPGSCPRAS